MAEIEHLTFTVATTEAGQRLDDFLIAKLARVLAREPATISKAKVRRLIMAQAVSLNQSPARVASISLDARCRVSIKLERQKFLAEKSPDDISFELDSSRILFEDAWLIVIDKPAGLPTEATIVASRDHLQAAVVRYLAARDQVAEPYVGIHHRLDRETSGLILFTKQKTANPAIHQAFLQHQVQKTYQALCQPGQIPGPYFEVVNQLGRISPKSAPGKWGAVKQGGDAAQTSFSLLQSWPGGHLVEARPRTGRTHQIRVHLAGLGLSLLGDSLYGGPMMISCHQISRVMLHAATLCLPHPITGQELQLSAPLPADFRACLAALAAGPVRKTRPH